MNFEVFKQADFESTCESLICAIDNGEISTQDIMEDTAPNCIYPDDVSAVDQWVGEMAEELHKED